jgi:hypothetical protein
MNKMLILVGFLVFLLSIAGALADYGVNYTNSCYSGTYTLDGNQTDNLQIVNSCQSGSGIFWETVNQTVLGAIVDGDVVITSDWIYVDSSARPDLDVSAMLIFKRFSYATQPDVLKDGALCGDCDVDYFMPGELHVNVTGFSNYSLTGKQEFTVYSDQQPELQDKVYQTVDLGDAKRSQEYSCIVQLFGQDDDLKWNLIQTNPERKVQAKPLGNPDVNQPESLGYFPTVNGLANTYWRSDYIAGYNDFTMVIQCTNNSSKLIYEEPISTRYRSAGRSIVARSVWLTDGDNAFYLSVSVIGGMLIVFIGGLVWRSLKSTYR